MSKAKLWYGDEIRDIPPSAMLDEALKEWGLRLSKFNRLAPQRHVAIRDSEGACVGFYTPHLTASGVRFGPIYIAPEHRGKGHAAAVYREWIGKVACACVIYAEDGNDGSARAAEAAGMQPWKRGPQGTYWRGSR
jgi:RimJ/RimL family protein N-acetyltransferase